MPTHPKQVCGLYYFRCIGGVTMEPEEYNGFMIVDAPGQMFKATKIVPSPYFKGPLNACSIDSLKISINYELGKINRKKKKKTVKN